MQVYLDPSYQNSANIYKWICESKCLFLNSWKWLPFTLQIHYSSTCQDLIALNVGWYVVIALIARLPVSWSTEYTYMRCNVSLRQDVPSKGCCTSQKCYECLMQYVFWMVRKKKGSFLMKIKHYYAGLFLISVWLSQIQGHSKEVKQHLLYLQNTH